MDKLSEVNHYYRDSMDGSTCEISRQWYEEAKDRLAAYEDLGTPEQLSARVEVVRCGECVNRFTAHCPMAFESIHPDFPSYAGDITEWTEDDWYCQRGTRADAEGAVK